MPKGKVFKLVLVPFPLTPLAAYWYWLYRMAGQVTGATIVKYHFRTKSSLSQALTSHDILSLLGENTNERRREFIGFTHELTGDGKQRWVLKRLLNHIVASRNKPDVARLALSLCATDSPQALLEAVALPRFDSLYESLTDAVTSGIPGDYPRSYPPTESEPLPSGKLLVTLPVCETQEGLQHRRGVSWKNIELVEGRACRLVGQHLVLAVGGPSGSGKSTLSASLANELANLVASLGTRTDWASFNLKVSSHNTDSATPTLQEIETRSIDHEVLLAKKRPWTTDLAWEAMQGLAIARQKNNITIADLPGGSIDEITEITAALADGAIIVTKDWERIPEWKACFASLGVPVVSQSRSHTSDEGFDSVVTRYTPGEVLAGRVSGLDRLVRSWDSFVSCLAKFLLFDILPTLVEKRERKRQRYINELTASSP